LVYLLTILILEIRRRRLIKLDLVF
jgi:hypothetical protein